MADVIELEYQKVLAQYGVKQESLPIEIRNKIKGLSPLVARYNKNPTENMKQAVIKQDIEIADLIANLDEEDLPDEATLAAQMEAAKKAAAPKEPTPEEKAAAQKVIDDKSKADAEAARLQAEAIAAQAEANANAAKENEIKQLLSTRSDKRVTASELAKILGSIPTNPTLIGAVKLRQVPFNSSYFELV